MMNLYYYCLCRLMTMTMMTMLTIILLLLTTTTISNAYSLTTSQYQLLQHAYIGNNYDQVTNLIDEVSTLNYEDQYGNTPLTMAIQGYYNNNIQKQNQIKRKDNSNKTILSSSDSHNSNNHTRIIELLLSQQYNPNIMDITYGNGRAFHCACSTSSINNGEDSSSSTSIDMISLSPSLLSLPLSIITNTPTTITNNDTTNNRSTITNDNLDIDDQNDQNDTKWDYIIRLLIKNGADMNCYGSNKNHYHNEIISSSLSFSSSSLPSVSSSLLTTPLYDACYNKQLDLVKLLLSFEKHNSNKNNNIDVNCCNNDVCSKQTALHVAIMPLLLSSINNKDYYDYYNHDDITNNNRVQKTLDDYDDYIANNRVQKTLDDYDDYYNDNDYDYYNHQ